MAVIQISKIQQRRGQTALTGFPQLSSGEFGWSIDTQELYIGNGSVDEGAPAVGNTQLITEHNINNFFKYADNGYQYKDDSRARFRTIQSKLDDNLNLNDIADITTITEHSEVFRIGIEMAVETGKPLIIPEGNYAVTATIKIPSFVELRGAGSQKTVIYNVGTSSIFQTVNGNGITFDEGIESYATVGVPRNIRINGFTFVSSATNAAPIMQLDCIADSFIEECEFVGDIEASAVSSAFASGINFRDVSSYPSNLTKDVTVRGCTFYKLGAAISSEYDISDILIRDSKFYFLNEGVVFGKNLVGIEGQKYGAQHVNITDNKFDTINRQAVYSGSTSTTYYTNISSNNNYYYRVGNNGQGDGPANQAYEVIHFGAYGNYSNSDTFDRLNQINLNSVYLTQNSTATVKSIISGPAVITPKSPLTYDITDTGSSVPMFVFPRSTYQYKNTPSNQIITVDYTINKPSISMIRKGSLDVIINNTSATVKDSYTTNDDVEGAKLTFTAAVSTSRNTVSVLVNNQSVYSGNIIYTYTVRQ